MKPSEVNDYVENTLNWAECRMKYHEQKDDIHNCLAIAQEFHEWYMTDNGEEYNILCVATEAL
jgi:hypothetical protein